MIAIGRISGSSSRDCFGQAWLYANDERFGDQAIASLSTHGTELVATGVCGSLTK